jgi:hypothetical protein
MQGRERRSFQARFLIWGRGSNSIESSPLPLEYPKKTKKKSPSPRHQVMKPIGEPHPINSLPWTENHQFEGMLYYIHCIDLSPLKNLEFLCKDTMVSDRLNITSPTHQQGKVFNYTLFSSSFIGNLLLKLFHLYTGSRRIHWVWLARLSIILSIYYVHTHSMIPHPISLTNWSLMLFLSTHYFYK